MTPDKFPYRISNPHCKFTEISEVSFIQGKAYYLLKIGIKTGSVRILKHIRIQSEIILDNITTCFGSTLLKILPRCIRIHIFPHLVSSLLFNCNIGLFICIDSRKPLLLMSKSTCTIYTHA